MAEARKDPVAVDSRHYTVLVEDAKVRVLRASYGPGEGGPGDDFAG
jgi:hypothetical protein